MIARVAGYRPRPPADALAVDYADVLRQAVENERWRVLREVRREVEAVKTSKPHSVGYLSEKRDAVDFKRDALAALDRLEARP